MASFIHAAPEVNDLFKDQPFAQFRRTELKMYLTAHDIPYNDASDKESLIKVAEMTHPVPQRTALTMEQIRAKMHAKTKLVVPETPQIPLTQAHHGLEAPDVTLRLSEAHKENAPVIPPLIELEGMKPFALYGVCKRLGIVRKDKDGNAITKKADVLKLIREKLNI